MKARYVQKGESLDYIPSADVNAGEIVFMGNLAGIAKLDITANTLGALAVTGVFEVAKKAGEAVATGDVVFWNGNEVTKTQEGGKPLGTVIVDSPADSGTVRVLINAGVYEG